MIGRSTSAHVCLTPTTALLCQHDLRLYSSWIIITEQFRNVEESENDGPTFLPSFPNVSSTSANSHRVSCPPARPSLTFPWFCGEDNEEDHRNRCFSVLLYISFAKECVDLCDCFLTPSTEEGVLYNRGGGAVWAAFVPNLHS